VYVFVLTVFTLFVGCFGTIREKNIDRLISCQPQRCNDYSNEQPVADPDLFDEKIRDDGDTSPDAAWAKLLD
jgi:hypothetical protein